MDISLALTAVAAVSSASTTAVLVPLLFRLIQHCQEKGKPMEESPGNVHQLRAGKQDQEKEIEQVANAPAFSSRRTSGLLDNLSAYNTGTNVDALGARCVHIAPGFRDQSISDVSIAASSESLLANGDGVSPPGSPSVRCKTSNAAAARVADIELPSPFENKANWPPVNPHSRKSYNPCGPALVYNIRVDILVGGFRKDGGAAVVEEGRYTDDLDKSHNVVVKSLKSLTSAASRTSLKNEITILGKLPMHDNIIRPFGFCLHGNPYIVLEFLPTSLHDFLFKRSVPFTELNAEGAGLTYQEMIDINTGIVSGLQHIHRHGVIHNDIKPSNILLDDSLNAKLIDFGFAERSSQKQLRGGTAPYMAPQRLSPKESLEDRDDVYSLGTVMWNCLTAGIPERKLEAGVDFRLGDFCRCRELSRGPFWEIVKLVNWCWKFQREKRPSLSDVFTVLSRLRQRECTMGRPSEDLELIRRNPRSEIHHS